MRAIGYVRVSTEEQAKEGLSLSAQRERIAKFGELYQVEVVKVFEDAGVSGKSLNRDGIRSALAFIGQEETKALIVCSLDRLTRSVRDLSDLLDHYFQEGKFQLLSVGEQIDTRTASGRLVVNILGSVAQWQRENIGEQATRAAEYKKSKGEYTGGFPPYGFELDPEGNLIFDSREQKMKVLARSMREQGRSLRCIGRELEREGFLPRSGSSWRACQVACLLKR